MNKLLMVISSTVLLVAALGGTCTGNAWAQDQASSEEILEEVIVTARRWAENLQEVPESITAFDAEMIDSARIRSFRDIADLTPSLGQLSNFRPGLARIQIRGLITPQVGDPPIAFVVDGITSPDLEFINQELFDIERIEVLRGAQGAIYGRGAIGGAVNIVTKQPTDEFEGNVTGSYANGQSFRTSVSLSGPITEDKVYYRLGAYYQDSDGLIDNAFLDEKADFINEKSVLGLLKFDLNDTTFLDLHARYTTIEAGMSYFQNVSEDTIEDFSIQTAQNVQGVDERDLFEISARLERDLEFATLELIGGYSGAEDKAFSDTDYSAVPSDFIYHFAGAQESLLDLDAWTLEGRLTSSGDGPLQWAMSAFYQDRQRNTVFDAYDDPVGDQEMTRADFTDDLLLYSILDDNSSNAWAVAGQVKYDINDRWELTGALRFDQDKRQSFDERIKDLTFAEKTFSEWQPKASLAYAVSDTALVYAGYSRGFRSGGFNEFHPDIQRVFGKEVSDSFDLGFKMSFLDQRMTLNGSVFLINQDDAQVTLFNIDTFTLENITVDEVQSKGFELEFMYNAMDGLNFSFNGGIVDSEIQEFVAWPDLIGYSMPHVSEYNINAVVDYIRPVTDTFNFVLYTAVRTVGPRLFDFAISDIESSSGTFVDVRLGLENQTWSVSIFADNLFDERSIEDLFLFDDGVTDLPRLPNRPRFYGVELRYFF